jgi:hypothetical protein
VTCRAAVHQLHGVVVLGSFRVRFGSAYALKWSPCMRYGGRAGRPNGRVQVLQREAHASFNVTHLEGVHLNACVEGTLQFRGSFGPGYAPETIPKRTGIDRQTGLVRVAAWPQSERRTPLPVERRLDLPHLESEDASLVQQPLATPVGVKNTITHPVSALGIQPTEAAFHLSWCSAASAVRRFEPVA